MEYEEFKNISAIYFPNTVSDNDKGCYTKKLGFTFEKVVENGEMAGITWIAVFKEGKKVAHIKQSVCDIYF